MNTILGAVVLLASTGLHAEQSVVTDSSTTAESSQRSADNASTPPSMNHDAMPGMEKPVTPDISTHVPDAALERRAVSELGLNGSSKHWSREYTPVFSSSASLLGGY